MESLTRREEQILLAILFLKADAYLVAIRRYLSELMKKEWSIGAVHIPLKRLEEARVVESFMGEATAIRGGRRKKIYQVSKLGLLALSENKKISDSLWQSYAGSEFGQLK